MIYININNSDIKYDNGILIKPKFKFIRITEINELIIKKRKFLIAIKLLRPFAKSIFSKIGLNENNIIYRVKYLTIAEDSKYSSGKKILNI